MRIIAGLAIVAAAILLPYSGKAFAAPALLPSGSQLLNRAVSAVKSANSFHLHYVLNESSSDGTQEISRRDGDVALRRQLFRLHLAVTVIAPKSVPGKRRYTQTQDVLVAGPRGAERHPGNVWLCAVGYTDQTPPTLVSLKTDQILAVRNLGPTAINRVPVWRVRVDALHHQSAQTVRISVYEYIARAGNRLLRETLDLRYRQPAGPLIEDRSSVDYSKFGEPLHVKVPACRPP